MHAIVPLPFPRASNRLALTTFAAVLVHLLVILGVSFAPREREPRVQASLDVTLVRAPSPTRPEETSYVAEADQEGDRESVGPPPAAPEAGRDPILTPPLVLRDPLVSPAPRVPAPAERRESARPEVSEGAGRRDPTAATGAAETTSVADATDPAGATEAADPVDATEAKDVAALPAATESAEATETPPSGAGDLSAADLRAQVIESLSTALDERLQAYAERPRRKWITARTREHAYAAYMEAWRQKVERVGNLNYPNEARRRALSGSLSLDVALNADGSVAEIFLRRSSGEKVLDDAAVRIVELAAPFARFPPSIREEVDLLHIERTWVFSSRNEFNSR